MNNFFFFFSAVCDFLRRNFLEYSDEQLLGSSKKKKKNPSEATEQNSLMRSGEQKPLCINQGREIEEIGDENMVITLTNGPKSLHSNVTTSDPNNIASDECSVVRMRNSDIFENKENGKDPRSRLNRTVNALFNNDRERENIRESESVQISPNPKSYPHRKKRVSAVLQQESDAPVLVYSEVEVAEFGERMMNRGKNDGDDCAGFDKSIVSSNAEGLEYEASQHSEMSEKVRKKKKKKRKNKDVHLEERFGVIHETGLGIVPEAKESSYCEAETPSLQKKKRKSKKTKYHEECIEQKDLEVPTHVILDEVTAQSSPCFNKGEEFMSSEAETRKKKKRKGERKPNEQCEFRKPPRTEGDETGKEVADHSLSCIKEMQGSKNLQLRKTQKTKERNVQTAHAEPQDDVLARAEVGTKKIGKKKKKKRDDPCLKLTVSGVSDGSKEKGFVTENEFRVCTGEQSHDESKVIEALANESSPLKKSHRLPVEPIEDRSKLLRKKDRECGKTAVKDVEIIENTRSSHDSIFCTGSRGSPSPNKRNRPSRDFTQCDIESWLMKRYKEETDSVQEDEPNYPQSTTLDGLGHSPNKNNDVTRMSAENDRLSNSPGDVATSERTIIQLMMQDLDMKLETAEMQTNVQSVKKSQKIVSVSNAKNTPSLKITPPLSKRFRNRIRKCAKIVPIQYRLDEDNKNREN